jgi:hypothetical protein
MLSRPRESYLDDTIEEVMYRRDGERCLFPQLEIPHSESLMVSLPHLLNLFTFGFNGQSGRY